MKKSIVIFQILFSGLVLSGGNVLTAAELPLPALWYEFNGNLKPTCGDVNLTRWDTATNKADDDGEGGSYCEVRASLVNNAVTGCEPYSSSLGITDYASEGWTMAFSAKPSAVTNAVLFCLRSVTGLIIAGTALLSFPEDRMCCHWLNGQRTINIPFTLPEGLKCRSLTRDFTPSY